MRFFASSTARSGNRVIASALTAPCWRLRRPTSTVTRTVPTRKNSQRGTDRHATRGAGMGGMVGPRSARVELTRAIEDTPGLVIEGVTIGAGRAGTASAFGVVSVGFVTRVGA